MGRQWWRIIYDKYDKSSSLIKNYEPFHLLEEKHYILNQEVFRLRNLEHLFPFHNFSFSEKPFLKTLEKWNKTSNANSNWFKLRHAWKFVFIWSGIAFTELIIQELPNLEPSALKNWIFSLRDITSSSAEERPRSFTKEECHVTRKIWVNRVNKINCYCVYTFFA